MDDGEREQALLTALTTEHFVLQTSRSATVTESVGRATVFLSMLSAALIGLGFVASNAAFVGPYLGAVLPTLMITGLLTFLRLVQNMVENELDLARIQRIRAYYQHRLAGEHDFFADAVQDASVMRASWAAVGNAPRRAQLLLTTAAMVGAVNALLAGLSITLLVGLAGLSSGLAIGVGTVLALLAFAAQVAYINRASISQPG
ncbi:hypothetical protein GA0070607_5020 [Micromonospora coriariae]|uniref:Uncharacterized protein n=1 Tax=Micromonospora coriariae TaxID=285665 RepID=A0A1C4XBN2_9ACTN|nr:hypothetical protein [Micromonospora coriariae]SCF05963.1 hypothetical protein GA0070607_5020 [Micromonospora coriariae]